MNNVTWCILLIAMLIWKMDAVIIDIETTFLHGELDKEIYMDLLAGLDGDSNECLLLLKVLYGLVQGACQWWKKFVEILKKIKFQGGYADLCLMIKRLDNNAVFASIYINIGMIRFCREKDGKRIKKEFTAKLRCNTRAIRRCKGPRGKRVTIKGYRIGVLVEI